MHRNHHNKPKNKNTSNQIVHAKNRVLTLRKLMHEQKHGNMLRIFSTYIIELKQCSAKTIHISSTHDHNDKSCGCHYSQYPHHKSCVFQQKPSHCSGLTGGTTRSIQKLRWGYPEIAMAWQEVSLGASLGLLT